MPKIFFLLVIICLSGFGCSVPNTTNQNDFEPVRGGVSSTQETEDSLNKPYSQRIMTAISYDGLNYVSNNVWISDQAFTPDAVITTDGTIYLYYTGWIVGDRLNTTAVAISKDQGQTWTYKYVEITEGGPIDRARFPDVFLLEDGTFRMFFTGGNPQGIHYAESSDGMTYVYKGVLFSPQKEEATNSTTWKVNDTWHLYALSTKGADGIWHLTSNDGRSFSVYELTSFPVHESAWIPSNDVTIDEKKYALLFHEQEPNILSLWSKNGFDWYPSELTHLKDSNDESKAQDSTVVKLDDGRYLMFYVTTIL